ncbi:MAG: SHOCT domain-containing protein [Pseudomonadota bacterium]
MMGNWEYGMGFGGPVMILFWIVIIAALVALVARLVGQSNRGGNDRGDGPERALEILEQRYARGEIDSEEFERKRQDLRR